MRERVANQEASYPYIAFVIWDIEWNLAWFERLIFDFDFVEFSLPLSGREVLLPLHLFHKGKKRGFERIRLMRSWEGSQLEWGRAFPFLSFPLFSFLVKTGRKLQSELELIVFSRLILSHSNASTISKRSQQSISSSCFLEGDAIIKKAFWWYDPTLDPSTTVLKVMFSAIPKKIQAEVNLTRAKTERSRKDIKLTTHSILRTLRLRL